MISGIQQIIKSQEMLKCPYDPNHNVPRETFFKHLDKCKSPYKDLYVQCPFNPFHYPRKQKQLFRKHCRECPQRLKWLSLQQSNSQQYQALLNPDIEDMNKSLRQSMVQPFQFQNNNNNFSSLSQQYFVKGVKDGNIHKQFNEDDSKSIYFSKVLENDKSKIAQSQVFQNDVSRNQQSLYLSQLNRNGVNQHPYAYSQYGDRYVPPPSSLSQYNGYGSQYGFGGYNQGGFGGMGGMGGGGMGGMGSMGGYGSQGLYGQMGNVNKLNNTSQFGLSPYMNGQERSRFEQQEKYGTRYENEEFGWGNEESECNGEERGQKRKKEKKEKKDKKDKKQKKEKKEKKSERSNE